MGNGGRGSWTRARIITIVGARHGRRAAGAAPAGNAGAPALARMGGWSHERPPPDGGEGETRTAGGGPRRPGAGCAGELARAPPPPGLAALLGLLLVALGLRIALSLAYQPATLSQFDANVYVWQAQGGLFASALQAPGIRDSCGWRTCSATRSR